MTIENLTQARRAIASVRCLPIRAGSDVAFAPMSLPAGVLVVIDR